MLSRSMVRIRVALLLFCLCNGGPASAQVATPAQPPTGTLSGIATDETGAAIPEVRITVVNDATAFRRGATTGGEGTFTLPLLPAGQYTLRAEHAGFSALEIPNIVVSVDDEVTVRVQMKIEGLSEAVTVTAQKRGAERLQDVPVPVTVLQADTLAELGQPRLRDYFATIPGLTMTTNYGGVQHLTIRGLSTGSFTNPVVSVTVDDVPFGASTHNGSGNQVPDFDPGDLARIEVLRGPQGTLYGAASMGGLVRYVTKDPSFDGYSGRMEIGTSGVHNGDQAGFSLRGSANIPIGSTVAMRVSGYRRHDAGYIDNPRTLRRGVNDAYSEGARTSALWRPSASWSLKLGALYQHTRNNGQSEVVVRPGLGDLEQNYMPGVGWDDRTIQVYNAILNARVGHTTMTSVTAYHVNKATLTFDRQFAFGPAVRRDFGVPDAAFFQYNSVNKFSQELRFTGALGRRLTWMAAGFFANEDSPLTSVAFGATEMGQIVGREFYGEFNRHLWEAAGFVNVTYSITDRLDVQAGGRLSRIKQHYEAQPVYSGTAPLTISPAQDSQNSPFTYLVTPRFKVSQDLMLYARFASGYRPGGPNAGPAIADGAPAQYDADRTENYEVGIKGEFFDHNLSIDASLYHIAWKDIQIPLRTPQLFTYSINGSGAKSDGVELAVRSTPLTGLTTTAWVAFNDAVLTESFPANSPAHGVRGNRLSFGARVTGHVSAEQEFPLWAGTTGYAAGAVTWVGDRLGQFQGDALRQTFPAYTTLDINGGIRFGTWTALAYLNNATDRRGAIGGGIGYQPPDAFIYVRPRAIGLSFIKTF